MSKPAIFRTCRQIAAALCAILALSSLPPANALEKATLQLKWLHHYQFAGYYAALDKGFYRDAGLDVTILEGHPDMEVEKAVAEGQVDFGVGTSALLLHRAKGLDLVVLGQIFQHSPAVFLTPRKTGIRSIAGMAGKRFMYSNQHGDMLALLKKNGIEEKDIIQVPHKGDVRDLISGKADVMIAYSFNEPFVLEQAGEPYLTFSPSTYGIDFYGDNFFTSRRLIEKRPEFVKAFREATLRGWRYTMGHKAEIADLILAKYSREKNREWLLFEANQIETLIQPDLVELGYQIPSRWRHISEVFTGLGMLPAGFDPNTIVHIPKAENRYVLLFGIIILAIVVIAILTLITLKFRRLNRRLSTEIMERTQSEKALTISERKYASFFDLMPDMIGITRLKDGTFIEVNNGFVNFTGWSKEEAIGHTSLELGLWERETRARAIEVIAANGQLQNFEFILTRKSGEKRHTLMYMKPIAINGAEYLFFAAHDITESKLAGEALKQSEAFLKESQQAGMIGSYNFDIRSGTWTSNEILDGIFGIGAIYERSLAGWLAIIHPRQREEMREYLSRQIVGLKLPFDREYQIQRRCDGEARWVHGHGRLYLDENGNPERLVGIIQDVTERKLIEETLKFVAQKGWELSGDRFLPALVMFLGETFATDYVFVAKLLENGKFAETMALLDHGKPAPNFCYSLSDTPCENVVGKSICCYPENVRQLFPNDLMLADMQVESYLGLPLWDSAAEPLGLIAVLDGKPLRNSELIKTILKLVATGAAAVLESKRAEAERAQLELQLLQAQKLESLGVLAGGIAHDFNNILTAIMGNISYARMDLEATHSACAPLARAEKAARRAADLARQLLVFAKGGEPVKKVVSLRQIVDDAVALTLSGTNVQAVIDLPPGLNAVNADEGQINQSFHNIIINAVHAMPAGGRLTVSGENVTLATDNCHGLPAGDYVRISFADEGCGIPDEDLKRIFDPYFTNKAGGTGLGLASTYSIIRKHNGQISVSSTPGSGTTLTILLPALSETFTEPVEAEYVPLNAHGNDAILVMDDDEMVRDLAAITLKRFGYAVSVCMNGSEAIALYRAARDEGKPFSLVIMDLTIPGGMGGIEAARQIRAIDPDAHLIVSSGYSDDPVMANYTDYGFCASMEKPYRVEDISAILQQLKREAAEKS